MRLTRFCTTSPRLLRKSGELLVYRRWQRDGCTRRPNIQDRNYTNRYVCVHVFILPLVLRLAVYELIKSDEITIVFCSSSCCGEPSLNWISLILWFTLIMVCLL